MFQLFLKAGEIVAPQTKPRALLEDALRARDAPRCLEILADPALDVGDAARDPLPACGLPALHYACALNLPAVVRALADGGCDVGARLAAGAGAVALAGDAALHVCARADAAACAVALLERGARADAPDASGATCADLAGSSALRAAVVDARAPTQPAARENVAASAAAAADALRAIQDSRKAWPSPAKAPPAGTPDARAAPASSTRKENAPPASSTPRAPPAAPPAATTPPAAPLATLPAALAAALPAETPPPPPPPAARTPRSVAFSPGGVSTPLRRTAKKVGSAWSEREYARRRSLTTRESLSSASSSEELAHAVLEACGDTARAFASPSAEAMRVQRLFKELCGKKLDVDALVKRLGGDETLLLSRSSGCAIYDGASVLHALAFGGHAGALPRVAALGLSPWTVDTYGRTALHVAAEKGHVDCCDALRALMAEETENPLGRAAPADLCGRTPVAWASDRLKDPAKRDAVETLLFRPGDATVLPARERTPLTTPRVVNGARGRCPARHAAAATAGWRVKMEDAHVVCAPLAGATTRSGAMPSLYAVFDGHGGSLCANYAAAHVERCLLAADTFPAGDDFSDPARLGDALREALRSLDGELRAHPRLAKTRTKRDGSAYAEDQSGATALLVLVSGDHAVTAWLGDSKAALATSKGGAWTAEFLTTDHCPSDDAERARIEAAGCAVLHEAGDAPRVARMKDGDVDRNGALGTSRALGDFVFKAGAGGVDAVSSDAQVVVTDLAALRAGADRALVVLACDGLWDVTSAADCAATLEAHLRPSDGGEPAGDAALNAACDALVAACVQKRSRDNVTAVVVEVRAPDGDAAKAQTPVHPTTLTFDDTPPRAS